MGCHGVDGNMNEGKGMELYKRKITRCHGYVWRMQAAKQRNKKGRAMGGLVIGIKRDLYEGEEGKKEVGAGGGKNKNR